MHGLTLEQETALTICYMCQGTGNNDFTGLGMPLAFIALREMGMIKMTTDMSYHLVYFQAMLPAGAEHYSKARRDRRRFIALDDTADELIMRLALKDRALKKAGKTRTVPTDWSGVEDYRDLQNADLLSIQWADNRPYVATVTNRGLSYAEGWFEDQPADNSTESTHVGEMPLFSIVIRANPDYPIDRERLFEGTDASISGQFMQGNTPDLAALIKLPAVLTREFEADDDNATAVLGYIDEPSLNPVISKPILVFPSKRLLDLGIIEQWANHRTHWTVCEGDPFRLLSPFSMPPVKAASWRTPDSESQPMNCDSIDVDKKCVAVMMPFKEAPECDPVYRSIRDACIDAGFTCKRVDEIFGPNDIVDDIKNLICSAGVVIADLTMKNANVMYELGYAHGREKQVICIQEGQVDLPFDIEHKRTLSYSRDARGLAKLTQQLTLSLQSLSHS